MPKDSGIAGEELDSTAKIDGIYMQYIYIYTWSNMYMYVYIYIVYVKKRHDLLWIHYDILVDTVSSGQYGTIC
jgi:hypothetical protein